MAALIQDELGAATELIEGGRGEFTVWVDDTVVAKKTTEGFPTDEEAVSAVKHAIAQG